jgi:hypothetical protein
MIKFSSSSLIIILSITFLISNNNYNFANNSLNSSLAPEETKLNIQNILKSYDIDAPDFLFTTYSQPKPTMECNKKNNFPNGKIKPEYIKTSENIYIPIEKKTIQLMKKIFYTPENVYTLIQKPNPSTEPNVKKYGSPIVCDLYVNNDKKPLFENQVDIEIFYNNNQIFFKIQTSVNYEHYSLFMFDGKDMKEIFCREDKIDLIFTSHGTYAITLFDMPRERKLEWLYNILKPKDPLITSADKIIIHQGLTKDFAEIIITTKRERQKKRYTMSQLTLSQNPQSALRLSNLCHPQCAPVINNAITEQTSQHYLYDLPLTAELLQIKKAKTKPTNESNSYGLEPGVIKYYCGVGERQMDTQIEELKIKSRIFISPDETISFNIPGFIEIYSNNTHTMYNENDLTQPVTDKSSNLVISYNITPFISTIRKTYKELQSNNNKLSTQLEDARLQHRYLSNVFHLHDYSEYIVKNFETIHVQYLLSYLSYIELKKLSNEDFVIIEKLFMFCKAYHPPTYYILCENLHRIIMHSDNLSLALESYYKQLTTYTFTGLISDMVRRIVYLSTPFYISDSLSFLLDPYVSLWSNEIPRTVSRNRIFIEFPELSNAYAKAIILASTLLKTFDINIICDKILFITPKTKNPEYNQLVFEKLFFAV